MTDTTTHAALAVVDLVAAAEFAYDQAPEHRFTWADALDSVRREYLNRAERGLDALHAAGQLLPPGGRSRVEWGSRGSHDPIPMRDEHAARYAAASWGHALLQRTVVRWPDGSSYTGPWVEVPAAEAKETAA